MFLSDGKVNTETLRDMFTRAMVEQAKKTDALVQLYYGKKPKFKYFDGHSQGGRQAFKLAQEYPELYDGFMVGQPAISLTRFSIAGLYPQLVIRSDLGFDALTPASVAGGKTPAALRGDGLRVSGLDRVGALSVIVLGGGDGQPHFLTYWAGQEAAH